ncbi:MAG TPA: NlpC/P60 family protein [Paracoccaceae bacterium]|nr:NlpC/P60 family protein [Paracoccaceae bacterium]
MTDRRLLPANGRVAHLSLQGQVKADLYVAGEAARIAVPLTDLLSRPDGPRDRQLLLGEPVLVLERLDRHAFVQAGKDGYCGYVALSALGPDRGATHQVSAPATHLYATPSIKRREVASLSFGSLLKIVGQEGRFAVTDQTLYLPPVHVRPVGTPMTDPAGIAELFLGTPYLWGGNSRGGIDCSGLVQTALLACGIPCPGDSDLQWASVGTLLSEGTDLQRGDLLFWKGHVAMVTGLDRMIHANGFRMAVTHEGIAEGLARIRAQEGDVFLGSRRP